MDSPILIALINSRGNYRYGKIHSEYEGLKIAQLKTSIWLGHYVLQTQFLVFYDSNFEKVEDLLLQVCLQLDCSPVLAKIARYLINY